MFIIKLMPNSVHPLPKIDRFVTNFHKFNIDGGSMELVFGLAVAGYYYHSQSFRVLNR